MSDEQVVFITLAVALAAVQWFLFRVHPALGIMLAIFCLGFWVTFLGVIGVLK